jgi:hypothetical protein
VRVVVSVAVEYNTKKTARLARLPKEEPRKKSPPIGVEGIFFGLLPSLSMFDVKTLCGVPGSETPPVLEVSAYGLRCLSRRERERVDESVLMRKSI